VLVWTRGLRWHWLALAWLPGLAHAQDAPGRRLVAPSAEAPAQVAPGGVLRCEVETASGLTPPPGLQEDRAHRWFAISLCASGLPLGAPERSCFPLPVRNVRPLDGASLGYRVEAPVPRWVAPWSYDLALRFPGGHAELAGGVRVSGGAGAEAPLELRPEAGGFLIAAAPGRGARVRVHVGAAGMLAQGARFDAYPAPDAAHGFRAGFVALLALAPGARVRVVPRAGGAAPPLRILAPDAEAGRPVELQAQAGPGQVFWWLDAERGGVGRAVTARFVLRGSAPIQALLVSEDGRSNLAQGRVTVRARRAFGCALAARSTRDGAASLADLLVVALSWKLGARRRRRRPRQARAAWE
jgi:hypothetical protein